MKVTVYGPSAGNGSWPVVTRGLCEGLRAIGRLGGHAPTERMSHEIDEALPVGYDAPVAIHVGPPALATVMQGRGAHRERLAMIAPNSSWLPATIFTELERWKSVTGYVVPSTWAECVMVEYTELPVYLYHHGVAHGGEPTPAPEGFRVLHMASTHRQRKGTAELITAWCRALRAGELPITARLRLVCDGPPDHFEPIIRRAAEGSALLSTIELGARVDLGGDEIESFYQGHHVVCQPSRAEGFGLVPLEALAAGVPVIMTPVTGHADQLGEPNQAVVRVATGPDEAIDDGPGAIAPTVSVGSLTEALISAYQRRAELRAHAMAGTIAVRARWSWAAVAGRFVRQYPDLFQEQP